MSGSKIHLFFENQRFISEQKFHGSMSPFWHAQINGSNFIRKLPILSRCVRDCSGYPTARRLPRSTTCRDKAHPCPWCNLSEE